MPNTEFDSIKLNGTTYDITLPTDAEIYSISFDATYIYYGSYSIDTIYSPKNHTCYVAEKLGYDENTISSKRNINVYPISPVVADSDRTLKFTYTYPTLTAGSEFTYILPRKDATFTRGYTLKFTGDGLYDDTCHVTIYYTDGTSVTKGSNLQGTYYNVSHFVVLAENEFPFDGMYIQYESNVLNESLAPLLVPTMSIGPVTYTMNLCVIGFTDSKCSVESNSPSLAQFYRNSPSALLTLPYYLTGDTTIYFYLS